MAHGYPDYGVGAPKATVYTLSDMAELAARLGSIDTFHRGGDVILLDNFEDNIDKWAIVVSGSGSSVALSSSTARNGAKSAKLTTGDAAANFATMMRDVSYPALSRLGFEFSFSLSESIRWTSRELAINTGSAYIYGIVGYDPPNHILQYLDSAGAYQTFASGVYLYESLQAFHTAKLVVDFTTRRYVRFILGATTYDLSAYALRATASTLASRLHFVISVLNHAAGNHYIHVDDVIITQNEK